MKGAAGYFVALSIIGIMVGLFMVYTAINGNDLSAGMVLLIGTFVVIKEILDIFH